MKVYERIHRRKIDRKQWFTKLEIDVTENKVGIPFVYVRMKDNRLVDGPDVVIRLSPTEALRMIEAILGALVKYPLIVGEARKQKEQKKQEQKEPVVEEL